MASGPIYQPEIDYGRFDGTQNLNTIDGVTEIVNNINSHPEEALILPAAFVDICRVNQTGEKLVMSLLFDTVFIRPVAHSGSIRKPICDKILADYEIVQPAMDQSFGYRLWVRKPLKTQEESSTAPVASLN